MQTLLNYFLLVWKLLWDRRVPLYAKIAFALPLVYLISPIDIVPDFLIGLGQLDDVALVFAGMKMLEMLSPAEVVAEHRDELARRGAAPPNGENVVDAPTYRVVGKEKGKRG
jgi:uncharacterized membrane protein YkvA (DUF1232 family)